MRSQERAGAVRGSYILLIELPKAQMISVGRLETISFPRGYYAYVGSAMGGIKGRLGRHFGANKKTHWHIDYLLEKASINGAIVCETEDKSECNIAQALDVQFDAIPGFGSSDCKCRSHLFFANGEMKSKIMEILDSLGIRPRLPEFDLSKDIAGQG
jgi:sugar fermentation stimulation protein A